MQSKNLTLRFTKHLTFQNLMTSVLFIESHSTQKCIVKYAISSKDLVVCCGLHAHDSFRSPRVVRICCGCRTAALPRAETECQETVKDVNWGQAFTSLYR